ncbi:MAG: VCBS repeat-containing protein [Saprospiraceae bacterium]|nr:VCBS repeat-containing protein [Saprospiraceae bacterium]
MRQYAVLFTAFCLLYFPLQAQKKTFVEVSEQAGINHSFKVDLATFGGGACVLDFNNDGFEDIYVTGGAAPDVLYKNNGDGTFTNIHTPTSFKRTYDSYTQGVAAADINKDGYKDLIVTTMNYLNENRSSAPNLLYLNNGDGTFTDITEKWGLENFRVNSMAASFGDVNADGYPDLFIANYFSSSAAGISIYNEQTITNSFQPSIDYLFLNTSGQGFVDARAFYGLEHDGFGFQGIFTDYDNDGDLDLYIANDFGYKSSPNLMLRNEYPQKKFINFANRLALNYGMNAMGIAYCDYNFDGWMDYFVTNLSTSVFSANAKEGKPFIDRTFGLGVGISTIVDSVYTGPPVSWGANFFDFDHDTDMDLFISMVR